jgi:hypothetical protein
MPSISDQERARAEAMLRTVKNETGFGAGKEPLPFVRTVAERLGYPWGLNGKRGNPNDISKDILAWDIPNQQPLLVDVLIDSGGANGLTFDLKPYPEPAGAVFIHVGTAPPPPPPPTDEWLRDLLAMIGSDLAGMRAQLDRVQRELSEIRTEIRTRPTPEPPPPAAVKFPAYVGRLFGFAIRLTPE